jgi:hypothetical protein
VDNEAGFEWPADLRYEIQYDKDFSDTDDDSHTRKSYIRDLEASSKTAVHSATNTL